MTLITLLTDFGVQDEYVGLMKGVIAGIYPEARIVDITHQIEPQDVVHGAYILNASYGYFPAGTIHVAVVDPGVGGDRRMLAAEVGRHRFLAPDNGLLERVVAGEADVRVVFIENEHYYLHPVSRTFHGRDIFAPVAAHLAAGLPLDALGPVVGRQRMVSGVVPHCLLSPEGFIQGAVVAVDRFGNLMSNIDAVAIDELRCRHPGKAVVVELAGTRIGGIEITYDHVEAGTPLAVMGSRGLLEISVNRGNAGDTLGVGKNDEVRVRVA
jgi:S-adenosylmethionine hydrolase